MMKYNKSDEEVQIIVVIFQQIIIMNLWKK